MSLSIRNLCFSYSRTRVLDSISFDASGGEILCILGPNGSGKTTLLKCINRIITAEEGTVLCDDVDLRTLSLKKAARYISYVPQDVSMTFPLSVIDVILMGRIPYADFKLGREDRDIAYSLMEMMDLTHLAFKRIDQLSGGEKQRVLIARALTQDAPVLIMDEPTSNLDIRNQLETLTLIKKIVRDNGLTALMTVHDINQAAMFSDKIIMMKDKKVFSSGPTKDVLNEDNLNSVFGVDAVVSHHEDELSVRLLKPEELSFRAE